MKKNILVIENTRIVQPIIKKKLKKFNVIFKTFENDNKLKKFLILKNKKNAIYAIICSFGHYFNKNILEQSKGNLKYIISPTTGLDHINLDDCNKYKIKVISLKKNSFLKTITSTAELTWAMILSLSRNLDQFSNDVINKYNWNRNLFLGSELNGKNLGIIGYGRIGKIIAKYGKSFGMSLYSYEKNKSVKQKYKNKIQFISIKQLFKFCEVITIHIPLRGNYNFINKNLLRNISKKTIIINTSRGEIFEERALLYLIKNKNIKGLGLDVLPGDVKWKNKLGKKFKFIKNNRKNLILTPHIGGNTIEARVKTTNFVIDEFLKIITY